MRSVSRTQTRWCSGAGVLPREDAGRLLQAPQRDWPRHRAQSSPDVQGPGPGQCRCDPALRVSLPRGPRRAALSGSAALSNNLPASVRQRLTNKAKETRRPFQELLQYFALERYLYRLGQSPHAEKFILKGALLFTAWGGPLSRPTRDWRCPELFRYPERIQMARVHPTFTPRPEGDLRRWPTHLVTSPAVYRINAPRAVG